VIVFLVFANWIILDRVFARGRITPARIQGAVAVYLLVGADVRPRLRPDRDASAGVLRDQESRRRVTKPQKRVVPAKRPHQKTEVPDLERHQMQIELPIHVNRRVAYYRWTMLAPLVLLVLMAWSVFWIDPSLLPSQLAVSTASVFALIAFRLSMKDLLPPVHYMTRGDVFLLGCTLLVFSAFGQAVLTGRLAKGGRESLARTLDRWSRWIYLAAFGLLYWLTVS